MSGLLKNAEWILLGQENYKRRWQMTYFTDISSTPEFKAWTKKKLGAFDTMWNMLKKEV
jgi:hypothetical protein